MNQVLSLTYASSLTNLCEVNHSFDSGILRIAYTGTNRNGSHIDKATFERCIKTIYNCPIVCNYDRESDTLGGHDVELVRGNDGSLKLVNLTVPVGCIPESGNIFWETVEEDDGTTHEYLCAEALLWKRQEAYQKIKRDGIASQSMEITVKDGESIDGIYHIYDFEFTAFALIGVEPCFQSAALEFSKADFKEQFTQMMLEIKENFIAVSPSMGNDVQPKSHLTEGGEKVLEASINPTVTETFSAEGITTSELTIEATHAPASTAGNTSDFSLEGEFREELARVLEAETIQREWGECTRYWFVDYDKDANEVYCWDTSDWLLYGFTYEMNGDAVVIQKDSKKRKKFAIVDFDVDEQPSPVNQIFEFMEEKIKANSEWEAKYQDVSEKYASMEDELGVLRQFKADTENAEKKNKIENVFSQFEDLAGIEAFEDLRSNYAEYDADTIEEKCFAIRGRNSSAKFSCEPKTLKLKIDKTNISDGEPYGGIFSKYGIESKN